MKYIKFSLILLLFHSSLSFSTTPYSYSSASANNPMMEMFLIMMDMFGMVDYQKGIANNPYYSAMSPLNYGAMSGFAPGLSQMSPLSALSPMPSFNNINPANNLAMLNAGNPFNPSLFNALAVSYQSVLEGVWLGGNGDILVFMGDKFFYSISNTKKLTGKVRIVDNKIIADIDNSEEIIKFFFELKGGYLAIKVKKEILYFKKQI